MKKVNLNQQLSLFSDEDFQDQEQQKETTINISQSADIKSIRKDILYHHSNINFNHTALFSRLAQSEFRSSFHLSAKDIAYINAKGMDVIRQHAADFVAKRLAPAVIPNDGKQTPMRGHPVFRAQHATACCCRGCFAKWHHIPAGQTLTDEQQEYAVSVLMQWIETEYNRHNHR